MSAVAPDPHQVLVLLRHPKGGTWHIQPARRVAADRELEFAEDVAPATVKVQVRHGHGQEMVAGIQDRPLRGGHEGTASWNAAATARTCSGL